ncbi:MAG TPA: biotin--[acetyl-CoA-carboxylase] ligase [Intrasporangium sp.]|uniref:biotin--[acetyl-CoA-carboxylase] ligase n=1 Tax=Intrasporangium sp. TaxID=1925024 RepID=UPI002D76AE9B|nr:biotin--[acetyl-CoA-carboxylase] ligase [Intrasporangium sp.]HET7399741.1 biotin--[acetyl-CoA-carboxylase] ligase [Intrasporangium sp.]
MRNPFDVTAAREALVTGAGPWTELEFVPRLGSTNDRAAELVRRSGRPWVAVLTDHQTGGRGRLGRAWVVPDRASVAVSAVVPVEHVATAAWVPLLAGLALERAVRQVARAGGRELTPRLKWPNDVLLADDGDRKLSGILCELVPLGSGHGVVVGTGVNVDQTREELPTDAATSLALAGALVRREDLVVAYLRELARVVAPGAAAEGRAAYRLACATIGSDVRVHLPGGAAAEGRAIAVDDSGALVVATPQGPRAFAAGDVVHVRPRRGRLAESGHGDQG